MSIALDLPSVSAYIDEQRHFYIDDRKVFDLPRMRALRKRFEQTHDADDLLMLAYLSTVIPVTKTLDPAKKFVVSCWNLFLDPKYEFLSEVLHQYVPIFDELNIHFQQRLVWIFDHPRLQTSLLEWSKKVALYPENHHFYISTRKAIANILYCCYYKNSDTVAEMLEIALAAGEQTTKHAFASWNQLYFHLVRNFDENGDDLKSIFRHPLFHKYADISTLMEQGLNTAFESNVSLYDDYYASFQAGEPVDMDSLNGIYIDHFRILERLRSALDLKKEFRDILSPTTYIDLWSKIGIPLYIIGTVIKNYDWDASKNNQPIYFQSEYALEALSILDTTFFKDRAEHLVLRLQNCDEHDDSVIFALLDSMYTNVHCVEFFEDSLIQDENSLFEFFKHLFLIKHPEMADGSIPQPLEFVDIEDVVEG